MWAAIIIAFVSASGLDLLHELDLVRTVVGRLRLARTFSRPGRNSISETLLAVYRCYWVGVEIKGLAYIAGGGV